VKPIPWFVFILLAILSIFSLWGAPLIPFHPDESTQLFTSRDLDTLFSNPRSMSWDPEIEGDLRQRYRTLDAPLTRYVIGLGRSLLRLKALPIDWNWSYSWEENSNAGAVPDLKLLSIGRIAITIFLPFSLLLIYLIGKKLGGQITGIIAMLLLGSNALILLHTRRAMAEGILVFAILFSVWAFLGGDKRPYLAGLGMALAFNAKQSSLALLPIGLLAVSWQSEGYKFPLKKVISATIQYLGIFILVTFILNPFLWRDPFGAAAASWANRQDLLERQVSDTARLAPDQILDTPAKRLAVMLVNIYLAPSSFSEVGNYQQQTGSAENIYLRIPGHNLFRNPVAGGILIVLTIFGLISALLQLTKLPMDKRRDLVLILLATTIQTAALLITIPLPWQRYIIPLVPFTCLWASYAVGHKLSKT